MEDLAIEKAKRCDYLLVGLENLQDVKTFKFPEIKELEQAYRAFIKEDFSEYPDILFTPEFIRRQLVLPQEELFMSILYVGNQFSDIPFIARCLVAETDTFEGNLQFDCREQVVNYFGIISIEKIPLLMYLYQTVLEGPVMIHSLVPHHK